MLKEIIKSQKTIKDNNGHDFIYNKQPEQINTETEVDQCLPRGRQESNWE